MHDTTMAPLTLDPTDRSGLGSPGAEPEKGEVVSTHVLVEQEQVDKLRELSRRTRVAQSEYLREAVDDLLLKYDRKEATP